MQKNFQFDFFEKILMLALFLHGCIFVYADLIFVYADRLQR
jgi:hypothetical protein